MSAIKAGDLVRVAHECCEVAPSTVGYVCTVERIALDSMFCGQCDREHFGPVALLSEVSRLYADDSDGEYGWYPVAWLRKIPPISEPESITTDEGVTA